MAGKRSGDFTSKAWYLLITAVVVILDQASKHWALVKLRDGSEVSVITGLMNFSFTMNEGIAFGMLRDGNMRWVLIAVSIAAIGVVFFYLMKTEPSDRLILVSLGLLAGGILGNLVDRVRLSAVIDFIQVYYKTYQWPVFNLADVAISCGAALLALDLILSSPSPQAETMKDEQ